MLKMGDKRNKSTGSGAGEKEKGAEELQRELRAMIMPLNNAIKSSSVEEFSKAYDVFIKTYNQFFEKTNIELAKNIPSVTEYYEANQGTVSGWMESMKWLVELEIEKREKMKEREEREKFEKEEREEKERQEAIQVALQAERNEKEAEREAESEREARQKGAIKKKTKAIVEEPKHPLQEEQLGATMDLGDVDSESQTSDFLGFDEGNLRSTFSNMMRELLKKGQESIVDKGQGNDKVKTSEHKIPEIHVEVKKISKPVETESTGTVLHEDMASPTHTPIQHNNDGLNFDYSGIYKPEYNSPRKFTNGLHKPSTVPMHVEKNGNLPMHSSVHEQVHFNANVPVFTTAHMPMYHNMHTPIYSNPQNTHAQLPGPSGMHANQLPHAGVQPQPGAGTYALPGYYTPYQPNMGMPMYGYQDPNVEIQMPYLRTQIETKLKIPTFSGRSEDWMHFYSMFTKYVDEDPRIEKVAKFNTLRSLLHGRAFEVIRGFPMHENSYEPAWAAILERFNKNDDLIDHLIGRVTGLRPLRKGEYRSLEEMVNATNQMIQSLPGFGIEVSTWDPFVIHVLRKKFDEDTLNQWKMILANQERPTLAKLIRFLETRMVTMQPREAPREAPPAILNQNFNNRGVRANQSGQSHNVHQVVEQTVNSPQGCFQCKGSHPIYKCPEMWKMRASERMEYFKKHGLCFTCLGQHLGKPCKFPNCPVCGGPHNTFLCYKKENAYFEQLKRERGAAANRENAVGTDRENTAGPSREGKNRVARESAENGNRA